MEQGNEKKWQPRKHEIDHQERINMNINRPKFLDTNQWRTKKKWNPQKYQFEPGERTYKKLMKYLWMMCMYPTNF